MRNIGFLLSCLLLIYTSNVFCQPTAENEITAWVNKNMIPVKYVTAGNGFVDLESLGDRIGNARIVALGECTHGSSEIFSMKHRMLEYLVKNKGFTIFSIEANMPEAYALNKYILKGEGNPKQLIEGMYFWTWYTHEVLDMVEWMKKYNDTAAKKVMFTGFDMQFPTVPITIVRKYADLHLPSLLSVINNYDTLFLQNRFSTNIKKPITNKLQEYAKMMIDDLSAIQVTRNDTSLEWTIRNAKILWQYAGMVSKKTKKGPTSGEKRDDAMAENIEWILDQNPGAKMVVWAHNDHIRKAKKFTTPMGYHLNKKYGAGMVTIGFSTEEGTYTAVKHEKENVLLQGGNILLPSTDKDIEYYFKYAKAENFIVDFRVAKNEPSNSWITKYFGLRSLGAGVNDKWQFLDTHFNKDFDMIIFLKKTTSSKCFRIL